MLANYTQDNPPLYSDGTPAIRIEMPLPVTREMLEVPFHNGVGFTKFVSKAMRFDEEFDYKVILPKGVKRWKLAKHDAIHRGESLPETEELVMLNDNEAEGL